MLYNSYKENDKREREREIKERGIERQIRIKEHKNNFQNV